MSYPKPLSKKNILKKYQEIGLTETQVDYLKIFFTACINLYGVIMAEDAWNVYRELSSKIATVVLRRKDMYAALGVFRRESLPFYVFEIDEVFSAEKRSDKERLVIHKDLISEGYYKFFNVYTVLDNSEDYPYFIPENFLDYVVMQENQFEKDLLQTLGNLKCTQIKYKDNFGTVRECKYVGKYLKDFSFIGFNEEFELSRLRGEIKGYKCNAEKAAQYEVELNSISAAEYLVKDLKRKSNIGCIPFGDNLDSFFSDLNEMGVITNERMTNKLINLIAGMHNYMNLWCISGWTPEELSKQRRNVAPTVTFGDGMKKAFADGTIRKEELVQMLREMGISILD